MAEEVTEPTLPGVNEVPKEPELKLEDVVAQLKEKDVQMQKLVDASKIDGDALLKYRESDKKMAEKKADAAKKKEDELVLNKDYQKLSENRENIIKDLKIQNATLSESKSSNDVTQSKLDAITVIMKNTVDAEMLKLSAEHQKIVKGLSSWNEDDVMSQRQALNDFGTLPIAKLPFVGSPTAGTGGNSEYDEALKKGDTTKAIAFKLRQLPA